MNDMTTSQTAMMHPAFCYGEAEHAHYEHEGYYIFPHFLSAEALWRCQDEIDSMIREIQPGRSADLMISCHLQKKWIFDLATQSPLLDMVERQVGPDIVLWSSHLVCKPPRTGRYVPWHQDAPYWELSGKLAAGVWIAFDDITTDNGVMSILPGWHDKGVFPRRQTADGLFSEEIDPAALPADLDKIKVDYLLKAGQAAIHHTMIPHNSTPNTSDRHRRVLVLRYMSADGKAGPKEYEDYRTGEKFARECLLVRGRDICNDGLRRTPFE